MEIRVAQVAAEVTVPLRHQVLRPHQDPADLHRSADPAARHFAAYDGDTVVGTAVLLPEPAPWRPERPAWRLRGVATAEAVRSRGVGQAVLAAVTDHVAAAGGGLLWCNARIPAQPFYERAGFVVEGEPWTDPDTGPHVRMWREVQA